MNSESGGISRMSSSLYIRSSPGISRRLSGAQIPRNAFDVDTNQGIKSVVLRLEMVVLDT